MANLSVIKSGDIEIRVVHSDKDPLVLLKTRSTHPWRQVYPGTVPSTTLLNIMMNDARDPFNPSLFLQNIMDAGFTLNDLCDNDLRATSEYVINICDNLLKEIISGKNYRVAENYFPSIWRRIDALRQLSEQIKGSRFTKLYRAISQTVKKVIDLAQKKELQERAIVDKEVPWWRVSKVRRRREQLAMKRKKTKRRLTKPVHRSLQIKTKAR